MPKKPLWPPRGRYFLKLVFSMLPLAVAAAAAARVGLCFGPCVGRPALAFALALVSLRPALAPALCLARPWTGSDAGLGSALDHRPGPGHDPGLGAAPTRSSARRISAGSLIKKKIPNSRSPHRAFML